MKVTRIGKILYGISEGLTFLAVVFAGALIAGAGWLMLEPREVPFLAKEVEAALNHPNSPYQLKVDKTILALGDFAHPLNVIVKDVELRGQTGEKTANIPAMHVSLGILGLLSGKISPDRVRLIEPTISIYQDKDGQFYLSGETDKKQIAMRSLFSASSDNSTEGAALFSEAVEELSVGAGSISFQSDLTKIKLTIPSADISVRQHAGIFKGRFDFKALRAGHKSLALDTYFIYDPAKRDLLTRFDFKDLVPADYAEVIPELAELKDIKLPLSGMVELRGILPDKLAKVRVDLTAANGTIQHPLYMESTMNILQFRLKGMVDLLKEQAKLDDFLLKLKRAHIVASGETKRNDAGQLGITANAKIHNLTKRTLMRLWPKNLGKDPRKWVDSSIAKTTVTEGEVAINIPTGSLEQLPLPEDAVAVKLHLTGAKVNYMEGFPPVLEGEGVLGVTGNTLTVDIKKANLLTATSLTAPATVKIPELYKENITIDLNLPVQSTAPDVVEFIKSTAFKLPQKLNFKPVTLSGDFNGVVKLNILDNISPVEDEITFNIETDIQNFNQEKFYKGMDLTAAAGKLIATDKKLEVEATGALQGQAMKFSTQITDKQENYRINAKLPHESLQQFGIDAASYITGVVGVDMQWQEVVGGAARINAKADLTKAVLAVEDIKYLKPEGEPASLTLQGISQNDFITLDQFQLLVPNRKDEVMGSAKISTAQSRIEEVNFNKLNFAGTTATGTYRAIAGGHYVHAKGSVLDLSYRDDGGKKKDKSSIPKGAQTADAKPKEVNKNWNIPALDLDLAFDKVIMSHERDRTLANLKLQMGCDVSICSRLNMEALAGKSAPFTMKIAPQNGRRVLTAYTPRADIFLREADIFDDMRKGEMQIIGLYQDEKPTHPLVGKLTIGEHRIKDVAALTKLLTLATFTGFVDLMGGSGLQFNKLVVPFTMENFVVQMNDAKTVGPSIGIVADGSLDLNRDTINLRGTVIPAYMFNSLIQSIPVLGNIFGAIAGDGLVAVRYSMLGALENPDVTVNPLSALTPGFLRGFFSIFEEANPDAKGAQDAEKTLKQLEGELNKLQVPEAQKHEAESKAEPEELPNTQSAVSPNATEKATAAPVAPVQEKPASVLSPKVKPTVIGN